MLDFRQVLERIYVHLQKERMRHLRLQNFVMKHSLQMEKKQKWLARIIK